MAASPAMAEIPPVQPKASPSRRGNAGRPPTKNQALAPAPHPSPQSILTYNLSLNPTLKAMPGKACYPALSLTLTLT